MEKWDLQTGRSLFYFFVQCVSTETLLRDCGRRHVWKRSFPAVLPYPPPDFQGTTPPYVAWNVLLQVSLVLHFLSNRNCQWSSQEFWSCENLKIRPDGENSCIVVRYFKSHLSLSEKLALSLDSYTCNVIQSTTLPTEIKHVNKIKSN